MSWGFCEARDAGAGLKTSGLRRYYLDTALNREI
ncbi:MAG: hypothetical protein JWM59_485 [Verrucomicrobiales bacterium]|nr:hypothetical protein [Verrucomicrobiales bacterium]